MADTPENKLSWGKTFLYRQVFKSYLRGLTRPTGGVSEDLHSLLLWLSPDYRKLDFMDGRGVDRSFVFDPATGKVVDRLPREATEKEYEQVWRAYSTAKQHRDFMSKVLSDPFINYDKMLRPLLMRHLEFWVCYPGYRKYIKTRTPFDGTKLE
jgi:hypothetical protein